MYTHTHAHTRMFSTHRSFFASFLSSPQLCALPETMSSKRRFHTQEVTERLLEDLSALLQSNGSAIFPSQYSWGLWHTNHLRKSDSVAMTFSSENRHAPDPTYPGKQIRQNREKGRREMGMEKGNINIAFEKNSLSPSIILCPINWESQYNLRTWSLE